MMFSILRLSSESDPVSVESLETVERVLLRPRPKRASTADSSDSSDSSLLPIRPAWTREGDSGQANLSNKCCTSLSRSSRGGVGGRARGGGGRGGRGLFVEALGEREEGDEGKEAVGEGESGGVREEVMEDERGGRSEGTGECGTGCKKRSDAVRSSRRGMRGVRTHRKRYCRRPRTSRWLGLLSQFESLPETLLPRIRLVRLARRAYLALDRTRSRQRRTRQGRLPQLRRLPSILNASVNTYRRRTRERRNERGENRRVFCRL